MEGNTIIAIASAIVLAIAIYITRKEKQTH